VYCCCFKLEKAILATYEMLRTDFRDGVMGRTEI